MWKGFRTIFLNNGSVLRDLSPVVSLRRAASDARVTAAHD